MLLHIDPDDARPIYRQVADEIKGFIARGQLRAGEALPPVRQVAADLGVNLNTIASAYRELQAEGLITVRHGARATVAERAKPTAKPASAKRKPSRPLRAALTELVLSGLPHAQILEQVNDELRKLGKGAKG